MRSSRRSARLTDGPFSRVSQLILGFTLLLFGCVAQSGPTLLADASKASDVKADDAKAANALLDKAMALYAKSKDVEVDDCALEGNWNFRLLHLISQAVELDPKATLARLDNSKEFGFKQSDYYGKWRLAVTQAWTKEAVTAVMRDRQWWPTVNSFPPTSVEFQENGHIVLNSLDGDNKVGEWQAEEGAIQVKYEGKNATLKIQANKYYFQMGQAWFYFLDLKAKSITMTFPWEMPVVAGPRVGDCGDYNF
ncbi:MAG: hypothetical protein OEZ68_04330 [Gammaproteobacteria bacterium]|nr:hypothetical protein [Gammaproteobacteria bacterium]MDH5800015.1 hypothetical protein [Gammaproteobacteria bacterium]